MSDEKKNKLTFWGVAAFIALLGVILFSLPSRAMQQAIVCNQPEHVEQVFGFILEGVEPEHALKAVNSETDNSCGVLVAEGEILEEVRNVQLHGRMYTVIKLSITGIFNGHGIMPVQNLIQFSLMPIKFDADA